MTEFDYDLFVIGGGSGGVRAARMSAQFGARVALCEERYLGGTCVNVGCVPKKLLVYGSHFAEEFESARAFGWTVVEPSHDWELLVANKDKEILRLNGIRAGDSTISTARSFRRRMSPCTSSTSNFSLIAVKPDRSEKTTAIWRRSPLAAADMGASVRFGVSSPGSTGWPHMPG